MADKLLGEWSGSRGRVRKDEKVKEVIKWLALFDYSDRDTLSRMFGAVAQGQGAFFKWLEDSKLVITTVAPGINMRVYGLSDRGFNLAKLILPHKPLTWRRTPSWNLLVHTLTVQKVILAKRDTIASFSSERDLDLKLARANHLPDALLHYEDGRAVALEVELNRKSTPRFYNIFLSHLKNIEARQIYQEVLYVFPNEQLLQLYKSKHDEPIWPIYVKNEQGRLIQKIDHPGYDAAFVHRAGYFRFVVEEVIKL